MNWRRRATIGLGAFLLGCAGMTYLAVLWCVSRVVAGMVPVHLHATAALYYSLGLMLLGAQFLSMGLLAELVTAYLSRVVEAYSIDKYTSPERGAPQHNKPHHKSKEVRH